MNFGDRSQDLGEGTSGLCNLMSLEESQKSDELCSETDDEDWAPEGKRRDRTKNEYEIAQILRKTDKELSDRAEDNENNVMIDVRNKSFVARREAYVKEYLDNMTDEELFVTTTQIGDQIKNSYAYKERSKAYAIRYINEHHSNDTSQDLLCSMSEMPKVVQESQYFLAKLNHLSKKDKSERLAMKELRKTMEGLKLTEDTCSQCY